MPTSRYISQLLLLLLLLAVCTTAFSPTSRKQESTVEIIDADIFKCLCCLHLYLSTAYQITPLASLLSLSSP
jgi:hypothetical protein